MVFNTLTQCSLAVNSFGHAKHLRMSLDWSLNKATGALLYEGTGAENAKHNLQ